MNIAKMKFQLHALGGDLAGGVQSLDLTDHSVDGEQRVVSYFIPMTEVMKAMFGDPAFKGKMQYTATPTFDADGERVFSCLSSGEASTIYMPFNVICMYNI